MQVHCEFLVFPIEIQTGERERGKAERAKRNP